MTISEATTTEAKTRRSLRTRVRNVDTSWEPARPPVEVATPAPAAGAATSNDERTIERSRAGAFWVGAIAAAVIVIALIVFIAQNSQKVTIHFVGLSGHFSLALALLVTMAGGLLLAAIPGTMRIVQLRRTVKKHAQH